MSETTADLIDAAEARAQADCEALIEDMRTLAERAQRFEVLCKRLTSVHPHARRIHLAMQMAISHLEGPGRRPEPENGEARDDELAEKVRIAREDAA